jgi:Lamin Tail Domain
VRSERGLAVLLALLGGCSYEWNALRPAPTFPSDVVTVDAVVAPDAVSGDDVVVAPDVVIALDVVDAAAAPDVVSTDVPAPQDSFDATGPDVVDAAGPDVVDAPAVLDRPDVIDVPPARDVVDVVLPDIVDVPPARDVVDVPPVTDTGPTCTGLSCPCHPGNPTGYCLVGQRCTAGVCADAPPAGALVITEIMNDPNTPISEPEGEWFEVYNPASYAVDLRGLRVVDASTMSVVTSSGPALLVLPLGYAVLARTANLGITGGTPVALATYDTVALNNSGPETLAVQTAGGTLIDTLTYGTGWPSMGSRTKALRPGILDAVMNDLSSNWCAAGTVYGAMHYGTPGAPNSCM